jgi:RNA polymerase sigma-70 factor (ECF subfamily)
VAEDDVTRSRILAFPGQQLEGTEGALGRAQVRSLLEAAVTELPPDLRLPFLTREVEGMSVLAIGRDLAINPLTVKTRLFRARRRLRIALERHIKGGFEALFPFEGARCAGMAERVVALLKATGRLRNEP